MRYRTMSEDHSEYLEYEREIMEIDEQISHDETDDMPRLEMSEFFREGD